MMPVTQDRSSLILKLALFATGLSGIVAEYILATLATYFLGDSVLQWTMILSVMLFSMGLGSRISQYFHRNLLEKFIIAEFILSILTGYSALLVYTASAFTVYGGFLVYSLSIIIGILIGLEIPLVTRLNAEFEQLRVNISSVMEKDYYGSLLGGVFFAFVGLPYLGLSYTPFILGFVNFSVALILYFKVRRHIIPTYKYGIRLGGIAVALLLVGGIVFAEPIILFGEQAKYRDKIVFEEQTKYQKIVITQWKDDYWLYINGNQQLSTLDEYLYHEPLVHPAMQLAAHPARVLILGGGDGCAAREVLKYPEVESIVLVDLDPVMTALGQSHPIFTALNEHALNDERVAIRNEDAFHYMEETDDYFDVIIIDLPDPKTVELGRLYSQEFYQLSKRHLRKGGILVTQATSPYYATRAFQCIDTTLQAAGFYTLPIHNQVITLGEWGWVLASEEMQEGEMKQLLQKKSPEVPTRWLNREAMSLITSFGKPLVDFEEVEVNKVQNPVLYRYYLRGNWENY